MTTRCFSWLQITLMLILLRWWRWWVRFTGCLYRRACGSSWLAWSKGRRPPGAVAVFIMWTEWTHAVAVQLRWQHYKYRRYYYYYYLAQHSGHTNKWYGSPEQVISELCGITYHTGSHSVTCDPTQVNAPRLTPARQAGTRFTYPGGMEGWVDLGGWLNTQTVYLLMSSHPSKY